MLYNLICLDRPPYTEIWGTLKQHVEVPACDVEGFESPAKTILKGTRVRIWMVSRFGDVGICDPEEINPIGYCVRIGDEHGHWSITSKRPDPKPDPIENWLENVQKKIGDQWYPVGTAVARS